MSAERVREYYRRQGEARKLESLIKTVEAYFELTKWSTEYEGGEENLEWDRGYQACMAVLRNSKPGQN